MKDYMRLATGRQIEVEDGTYLGGIVHIAEDEAAAVEVCAAITPAALTHVEFCSGETGEAYGIYDDLIKAAEPTRQTNEDETVTVTISLREKSDLEKREQWCRRLSRIVGEDLTDEFRFMGVKKRAETEKGDKK